jgi:hypothetical protein
LRRGFLLLPFALVLTCFALSPTAQAVSPPPDGGYPNDNTAEGTSALFNITTGADNTANGFDALFSNTTGYGNTANGANALASNTSGIRNTADGDSALFGNTTGNNNTADGANSLASNTTGGGNIALGFNAGGNLTTGHRNIDIGNAGVAGESNTIRIGTKGSHMATFIAGIHGVTVASAVGVVVDVNGHLGTVTSSERFKDEIKPMDTASEAILQLKPVTFRYKHELDPEGIPQFGLVAEQVEKVNPDLVVRDSEGKVYTVRYEAVNAMLLNEFLKQHRQVQQQGATIVQQRKESQATATKLEATITQLQSTVAKQEATIAKQQNGMEVLTATLKEQAAQIQQVSAQLELSKTAAQMVADNQ